MRKPLLLVFLFLAGTFPAWSAHLADTSSSPAEALATAPDEAVKVTDGGAIVGKVKFRFDRQVVGMAHRYAPDRSANRIMGLLSHPRKGYPPS